MISGGDALSCYAHFALQRLHLLPGEFAALDDAEKAFVIAQEIANGYFCREAEMLP